MALKEPESMDELFYFTRRKLENGGWIRAWVYRPPAPTGKGLLSKPVDKKTGRPKVRSKVYVDDAGNEYPCDEINETLMLEIKYKSPYTNKEGETKIPYKRKTYLGVPSFVFEDQEGNKLAITKKMKAPKKKKKK
jgi:hypothetical protein